MKFDDILHLTLYNDIKNSERLRYKRDPLHQETLRYLNHIKQVWSHLVRDDKSAMQKIETATVKALELRASWTSTIDAKVLHTNCVKARSSAPSTTLSVMKFEASFG